MGFCGPRKEAPRKTYSSFGEGGDRSKPLVLVQQLMSVCGAAFYFCNLFPSAAHYVVTFRANQILQTLKNNK
jgi:Sec-independent protein secretion pathway component TatC